MVRISVSKTEDRGSIPFTRAKVSFIKVLLQSSYTSAENQNKCRHMSLSTSLAQVTCLSSRSHGFESRRGYNMSYSY